MMSNLITATRRASNALVSLGTCPTSSSHRSCTPAALKRQCRQFSEVSTTASKEASNNYSDSSPSITSGYIPRHGPGDAVVLLNVGGKEFYTLRSTVALNAVLAEHVARAEANKEFTQGGKAVFVDRDPTHFPLILNHLRNKVEGLEMYATFRSKRSQEACSAKTSFHKNQKYYIQLPKDTTQLRDIYVEASHFQIDELRSAACESKLIVNLLGAFGSGSNPFDATTKLLQNIRRAFVTVGGLGAVTVGSQQDLSKITTTLFPAWFNEKEGSQDSDKDSPKELAP